MHTSASLALFDRVRRYIALRQITPTEFGLRVAKNSSLVARLAAGAVGQRTLAKVERYLNKRERDAARRKGETA